QHGAGDISAESRLELHALDARAAFRDRRGDIGVEPAPIRALERQAHEKELTFLLLPVDVETPLRLFREQQHVRTVRAMDAHAAAPRDIADYGIARHWLTTLGVAHHEPIDALDAHTARGPARGVRIQGV